MTNEDHQTSHFKAVYTEGEFFKLHTSLNVIGVHRNCHHHHSLDISPAEMDDIINDTEQNNKEITEVDSKRKYATFS